ncbi:beta-phosphoglucomutase family hydrolase [Paeniglutamicibacter terrestris]|uniref:Beta-phosphoglucomutase family hydrolase n=1 Tax=Paeniglutamicibacter terrestris TaxID=2723403 RepID=A0ABX1GB93_9MICC|nr:beta-phosphoglucomutase family hydrolase [Paeniglutamicibacter terrestris]NKG22775.1 beta-phosphoglucomutase family hydrolase [Paeniglutamicibacter terrestris]
MREALAVGAAYRRRDFKAVLFDLDGVLTPTAEVHRKAWQQLFENFFTETGVERPYTENDYFGLLDGRPRYEGVAAVLADRGIELPWGESTDEPGSGSVCALGNAKNSVFREILHKTGIEPYPGSVAYLRHIQAAGLEVAVVSSSRNAHDVLEAAGLRGEFSVVVGGDEASKRALPGKPAPDTFLAAAADLGWSANECVVIEDAISGVRAAAAGEFGLVVGVTRDQPAEALREAGADLVVNDLQELVNQDARDDFNLDAWSYTREHPRPVDPAEEQTIFSLGNGFLGMRGDSLGIGESTEGMFINGLHETWTIRHAESAFGLAETGQTMVPAPDARTVRVYINDEALEIGRTEILKDDLRLDFKDGTLISDTLWRTAEGHRVMVRTRSMISFSERHLALFRVTVRLLDAPAHVFVQSALIGQTRNAPVPTPAESDAGEVPFDPRKSQRSDEESLSPGGTWDKDGICALGYYVRGSNMAVSTAIAHVVRIAGDTTEIEEQSSVSDDRVEHTVSAYLQADEALHIDKFASFASSRRHDTTEMTNRAVRALKHLVPRGADELFWAQREFLTEFWNNADVVVHTDPLLQRAIRWNIYALAQASARSDGLGISAKGVSGNGYSGHYFWDTEIYVLPFLTYTNPQWARNALRARVSMIPAARRRAATLNEHGILFPWRTINGEEASAYYPAGTAQYHINADVVYSLARYVGASGDTGLLLGGGAEIVVETARLWNSLGFWREASNGRSFHIHGVTGPDEYTAVVNNNTFTNVMARFNLNYAVQVMDFLAREFPEDHTRIIEELAVSEREIRDWKDAAMAMFIPFSETVGIHPQDEGFLDREVWDMKGTAPEHHPLLLHFHPLVIYRFQVLKQADTVMALWLRSSDFTPEQKRADFDYYDPITTGDSTLSATVQSILAAEVGYADLALSYFEHALNVDLLNLHGNSADGVHVASTGGVWAALVYGFGGLRDDTGEWLFDPRLPVGWDGLEFSLRREGASVHFVLTADVFTASLRQGDLEITFWVRGVPYTLSPEHPQCSIALEDQGPVLQGEPSIEAVYAAQREDGSPLTSSIKKLTRDEELATEPPLTIIG